MRSLRLPFLAVCVGGGLLGAGACGAGPLDAVTVGPGSLLNGLVAHWTFDEGTGTVAGDHSGNRYDGQLTGGTWTASGRFGGALTLASGDYVTVPGFPQATGNWTVSAWTNSTAADLAAASDTATILSSETVFAGGWQIHLDSRPNYNRFDAAYWAGADVNDYVVTYCDCIAADNWIHLTAVWDDNAEQFTLYRDGVMADHAKMPSPILTGDTTLYFGTWNMLNRFLAGTIDDFAIWSRALSPAEVALLSTQPPGG
jgi:Concanavalin A-like lectin/glucanases superfamily